jgi:hypothetical protein
MKIRSYNEFVNENIMMNENSVKIPKQLEDAVGETSEMEPDDFDSATKRKIKTAQKKYQWVISDEAAEDMLGMDIDDVKGILSTNKIKFTEISHDEGIMLMF